MWNISQKKKMKYIKLHGTRASLQRKGIWEQQSGLRAAVKVHPGTGHFSTCSQEPFFSLWSCKGKSFSTVIISIFDCLRATLLCIMTNKLWLIITQGRMCRLRQRKSPKCVLGEYNQVFELLTTPPTHIGDFFPKKTFFLMPSLTEIFHCSYSFHSFKKSYSPTHAIHQSEWKRKRQPIITVEHSWSNPHLKVFSKCICNCHCLCLCRFLFVG